MGVEFVLGRPSSGREEMIVDKIRDAAGSDPLVPVLMIVPPQATYATECMLLQKLGTRGMMGVSVASISRVARRVLEEVYGGAEPVIDAAGKSMMIKRILTENAADFRTFGKMRARDFLPPRLSDAITELKQLDITPQMLRGFPAENPDTAAKFADLALLYEKLDTAMQGRRDTEDRLNLVTEHIGEAAFIREAYVVIHGFDMYNSQTVRFITEVMRTARHTVVSFLYAGPDEGDGGVYDICTENRARFEDAALALGLSTARAKEETEKPTDLLHLERNLFAYPAGKADKAENVSVSYAKSARDEVDGVAAQIAFLTQKRGYRFDEIALVCGDAPRYLRLVRERFRAADIPCYTGEKRGLLMSGLADFILSAFELARGRLKKDTLLAHAAAGYTNLTEEQRFLLENYAYSNLRDGFAFLKPFGDGAEEARAALMGPIEEMRGNAARAKDARGMAACVSDYLKRLELRRKVEQSAAHMREIGLLESAGFAEQAYEKATRVLEQAGKALGGEISGVRLARAVRAGFAAEEIAVIPPAANEVLCGDISGAALPRIRALFVLGVNEGVLPNYAEQSDVLTEEERGLLLGGMKGLKHTGKMDKQKLAIIKAFARPSEKLFLSCVRDGRAQPSPVLDRLFSLFGDVRENEMEEVAPLLAQNAWRIAVGELRARADGLETGNGPFTAAVLADEAYAGKMRDVAKMIAEKGAAARIKEYAPALYGEFAGSATRVEEYYECPYKHFLDYGLKVYEPREYEIDRLDVGLYAHSVLDRLARAVRDGKKDWDALSPEELEETLNECAAEAGREHGRYSWNKHNETVIKAVTGEIAAVAEAIRAQCAAGAMRPYETEYRFELGKEAIHGVIDRIDRAVVDGTDYFGIVDYKTGKKDFELSRMFGGLDLQLMIYIMAVKELMGDACLLGGANYMRVYGALRERGKALEPLYRMRGVVGADADAARKLFGRGEGGSLFAVSAKVRADDTYDKWTEERLLEPGALGTALRWCAKLVRDAKKEIGGGNTEIRPSVYRGEQACRGCAYNAVCMFDRQRASGARNVEKMTKADALERMREGPEEA